MTNGTVVVKDTKGTATVAQPTHDPAPAPESKSPAAAPAPAGSYDNLAHWPSAANRPAFNLQTNALTWIGPVGGGPSTSTDTWITQSLSAKEGAVNTNVAGQVFQGLHLSGNPVCITVDHNNVTIKRCYISWPGGSDKYNISITPGVTGTVIEDCEIDGHGGQSDSGSFNIIGFGGALTGCTVRRCNLHGAEQMVARTMQNVTVIDNWMHDTQGVDADMVEIYVDSGDSHDDLIKHNTFEQAPTRGYNSAINMSNWTDPHKIYDIQITNNRFLVPDFPHVICDDNRQGTGKVNYSATNNGFINTIKQVRTHNNNGISPNSGNFVLTGASDTLTSGAPYKGKGAI